MDPIASVDTELLDSFLQRDIAVLNEIIYTVSLCGNRSWQINLQCRFKVLSHRKRLTYIAFMKDT